MYVAIFLNCGLRNKCSDRSVSMTDQLTDKKIDRPSNWMADQPTNRQTDHKEVIIPIRVVLWVKKLRYFMYYIEINGLYVRWFQVNKSSRKSGSETSYSTRLWLLWPCRPLQAQSTTLHSACQTIFDENINPHV